MRFYDSVPPTAGIDASGWHRSTYSSLDGEDACVEVNLTSRLIGVRDSKLSASPVLTFSPPGWRTFVELVRQDAIDL
ncbi:DUF397 domain-containing protein [Amycolatopsis sp. BJA-103]|uniref:DUF397 domain-containing protein n=1 Tax=unclassified Amycolatopsis TaxID=2618356 RepID=UPI000C794DD9|nr:DUF397 domain-containing protein [Amycolatopsis sp. BJA-103]AUI62983.1 hypothetical protein BKN51_35780 [Amycolatopsis sp. BJA-103]PNE18825.1 hypothetical protein B1H26_13475 [Amycolatopsis sp. BJA-103]